MTATVFFSAAYKQAIAAEEEIMNAALSEIAEFCEKSSWLSEIYDFCKSWTEDSVKGWRGVQAFSIEVRLWRGIFLHICIILCMHYYRCRAFYKNIRHCCYYSY